MGDSIKEIQEKIKQLYTNVSNELLYSIIIVLVGFASFGLGAMSTIDSIHSTPKLLYDKCLQTEPIIHIGGAVVASRTGKRYYYPWCKGADRISSSKRVWYKNVEEARQNGKTPAKNCKGLR